MVGLIDDQELQGWARRRGRGRRGRRSEERERGEREMHSKEEVIIIKTSQKVIINCVCVLISS